MQSYYGEYQRNGTMLAKAYVHEINRFRFNWHDFIELVIVVQGRMEAYAGGQVYLMEEDDVLLINSNVGHATLLREVGTKAIVVHLAPQIFAGYFEGYENFVFQCVSCGDDKTAGRFSGLRLCAAALLKEMMDGQKAGAMYTEAFLLLLAGQLTRNFPVQRLPAAANARNSISQKTLNTIMNYTEKYYQKKITLNDMASLTQYNRSYISTFFKHNVGINYYEYLQRVRLRHAIQLLNKTPRSVTEIALDTGFADPKAFSVIFKRYFRMTPTQYRDSIKNELSPVIDELVRVYVPRTDPAVEHKLNLWTSLRCSDNAQKQ